MKKIRIGILGAGRLGRNLLRLAPTWPGVEVAAISDPASAESLAYLLKYDSVLGPAQTEIGLQGDQLQLGSQRVALLPGREPGEVAWGDAKVDLVIDTTGRSCRRADAGKHLDRGASRVLLCVPCVDADATVVMGHNQGSLLPSHRIIAVGSPTAHAALPVLQVLQQQFGLARTFYTAVHAYTSDQRLADMPADDLRCGRAAAENIVPQPGHADAVLTALVPAAKGRLSSMALKVPVANGAVVDMVTYTERAIDVNSVNAAMRAAAAGPLQHVFGITDDPIVSSDVKLSPLSGLFDAQATMILGEHAVKTLTWYDSGWGFAHRTLELVQHIAQGGV